MSTNSNVPTAEQETYRARYEALRAEGQGESTRALAPLTARDQVVPEDTILHRERLPGGWYWTTRMARGTSLRILNTSGTSTVSMIAWSEADPTERLNTADTMKVQWSTGLRKGRVIYTEMGRVAFSIVEDTSGAHDPIVGPTTRESMEKALGPGAARNSRDNFFAAAAKLGLVRRDVPACINFFAPVGIAGDGRLVWHPERLNPKDFVDVRAEMDLIVVLSNAGHPLDPDVPVHPEPVDVIHFVAPPVAPDDLCRNACNEVERAFEQTERHIRRRSES